MNVDVKLENGSITTLPAELAQALVDRGEGVFVEQPQPAVAPAAPAQHKE